MRWSVLAMMVLSIIHFTEAHADEFEDMSKFAQSICGDIPEGSFSRTTIEGKVKANAGMFAKLVSGGADVGGTKVDEIYRGIPFDKLPQSIPTTSMCKLELIKILSSRNKSVANTCRHPDFGQEGWRRTEIYSGSSGRVGGGKDQQWWCNAMTASFISSRGIGPQHTHHKISSSEESNKNWKGKVRYKYHCTASFSWEPLWSEKQDASHCGVSNT